MVICVPVPIAKIHVEIHSVFQEIVNGKTCYFLV